MISVVFSGVDVVVVVGNARVIGMAARRYRTTQNYKKCSIDRVRYGLDCEGICGPIKRALSCYFGY